MKSIVTHAQGMQMTIQDCIHELLRGVGLKSDA